jgi:hypothetical protein
MQLVLAKQATQVVRRLAVRITHSALRVRSAFHAGVGVQVTGAIRTSLWYQPQQPNGAKF